ncbi:MAG: NAD-dependent epimerase/dehydratase family protein [Candidatus Nanohaloarchaea archaeon]|nr:NAD-dependent epimerase/dehydratase family protein [Candidatus Nanohaloarchaea archaeon]
MKVLVAGASGFVGRHLIPELNDRGHDVAALDMQEYDGDAEAVVGDLTDYESFEDALEDVDAAYYLVHSMGVDEEFVEAERQCAMNFREACDEYGVDRVFYLGGIVGTDKELSEHLYSRNHVAEILHEGDADVTEFRAAMVLGWESDSFQIMYQLVDRLPVIIAPRWLQTQCQPIHVDDAIYYLVEALETPKTAGKTYEIGGADAYSYRKLLSILADELGRRRFIVSVPVLKPKLSSYWVDLVTDRPRGLIRALVESLRYDMTVSDNTVDDDMPHDCRGYRESIRAVLDERS